MTDTTQASPPLPKAGIERATALALRLAHAENALRALSGGQIDAIVDPDGKTYLLRPAQEQLRQNERRLQAVIDSAADVIAVVNRGGIILSENRAAQRILGFEPAELVGRNFFKLVHPDELLQFHPLFFAVLEEIQENATARLRHLAADGSWCAFEATMSKLLDASAEAVVFNLRPVASPPAGNPEPALPTAPDVHRSPARDRWLAIVAHELRTPLTPALPGVDELQEDERFAEARPTLEMMRRNLELQVQLFGDLDFTAVAQQKVRLKLAPINAHEAVGLVVEICRNEIAAAQINVRIDLQAADPWVLADSARLQQVMWNLLKSAAKFSLHGGVIGITSSNDAPDSLTLEFVDHGVGFEPELLPLIFDTFQQGDLTRHKLHGGLGLGLFIARGLAEAQGGTLTASSKGHGQGSIFRLTLPTTPPHQAALSTEANAISYPAIRPGAST